MNRVAIITGGGSGIGRAVSRRLAAAGYQVGILDLNERAAAGVAAEVESAGGRALSRAVDVADRASVDSAYAHIRSGLGPIGIVVTCAALVEFVGFEDLTVGEWDRTLQVNLTGTYHCIQAALADMKAGGWGRIVTISSVAGQTGVGRQAHYSASKAGVIGLTKAVARELAPLGITANTIPPVAIDTPGMRAADAADNLSIEAVAGRIPAGRLGSPDDIAALCAFLCSDDAGYVTGQVVSANGGAWM